MEDDAMVGVGMPRGSLAIVMTESEFCSNDIVRAHIPHGDLIRRFVTQDHPPYLSVRPDSEDAVYPYPIIALGPDSEFLGRVIGVVRDETVYPVINADR
jgi:SOS-response transcriptional repressor LexA